MHDAPSLRNLPDTGLAQLHGPAVRFSQHQTNDSVVKASGPDPATVCQKGFEQAAVRMKSLRRGFLMDLTDVIPVRFIRVPDDFELYWQGWLRSGSGNGEKVREEAEDG